MRAGEDLDLERFEFFDARAGAVRQCMTVKVLIHRGCGLGVATPLSCHVRLCPDCERARVGRLLDRFDAATAEMQRPVFLTLTTRNVAPGELAEALKRQRCALAKIRRRAMFVGGRCRSQWAATGPDGEPDGGPRHPCHAPVAASDCCAPRCAQGCGMRGGGEHAVQCSRGCPTRTGRHRSRCLIHPPVVTHGHGCPVECPHAGHDIGSNCPDFEHKPVVGGVAAVDLTWSETDGGTWHPHLHALIDAPWIDWAELRDVWQAATCTVRSCKHGRSTRCNGSWMVWIKAVSTDDDDDRRGAIREVLKYVAKPHGILDSGDVDRIGEYLWATRRLKLVSGFGRFYHLQVEEDEPDDDQIEIPGFGFQKHYVRRICPNCGVETTSDDWLNPDWRPRTEAHPMAGGGYAWRPPPAAT